MQVDGILTHPFHAISPSKMKKLEKQYGYPSYCYRLTCIEKGGVTCCINIKMDFPLYYSHFYRIENFNNENDGCKKNSE